MSEPAGVVVFVRDLMFSGRILAEARAQQVSVKIVRDGKELHKENGKRLIVDLNQEGAIEAAVAWKEKQSGEVVGFVSHVDNETIERARASGIDRVLSRGQFVQVVGELLKG